MAITTSVHLTQKSQSRRTDPVTSDILGMRWDRLLFSAGLRRNPAVLIRSLPTRRDELGYLGYLLGSQSRRTAPVISDCRATRSSRTSPSCRNPAILIRSLPKDTSGQGNQGFYLSQSHHTDLVTPDSRTSAGCRSRPWKPCRNPAVLIRSLPTAGGDYDQRALNPEVAIPPY